MEQNVVSVPTVEQQSVAPIPSQAQQPQIPSAAQVAQLNEQQMAKLQSELDVVQGNMRVLSEMLAYFTSSDQNTSQQQPDPADLDLLTVRLYNYFFYICVTVKVIIK